MDNPNEILELYNFGKTVIAGTTYRLNGFSEAPYSSFNLGFNSGDDINTVLKNYTCLIEKLKLEKKLLFLTNQVHGDKVKIIRKEDIAKGFKASNQSTSDLINFIDDYDGMLTDQSNVVLMTFYADCVPLIFFDPVKNLIGTCHAGWRGTIKKIAKVLINHMIKEFDSDPRDILVAIGPCASSCCYEVDEKVISCFKESFENSGELYSEKENRKYMLNLKLANKFTLLDSGIDEKNISISDNCTMCNNDLFYSYRIENARTGRHSAIITIK